MTDFIRPEHRVIAQALKLIDSDMFAEKLLANADRCQDRSVANRDAIDLAMLIAAYGPIPEAALSKATVAYGDDIRRKLLWAVDHLEQGERLAAVAATLDMTPAVVQAAIGRLAAECRRLGWS